MAATHQPLRFSRAAKLIGLFEEQILASDEAASDDPGTNVASGNQLDLTIRQPVAIRPAGIWDFSIVTGPGTINALALHRENGINKRTRQAIVNAPESGRLQQFAIFRKGTLSPVSAHEHVQVLHERR